VSSTYNNKMKQFKTDTGYQKEAQLMLTNPRDAFSGQSMSPNMISFDMLGMASCYCAIVTLSLRRIVF